MFLDLPSGLLKCGKLGHPVQMSILKRAMFDYPLGYLTWRCSMWPVGLPRVITATSTFWNRSLFLRPNLWGVLWNTAEWFLLQCCFLVRAAEQLRCLTLMVKGWLGGEPVWWQANTFLLLGALHLLCIEVYIYYTEYTCMCREYCMILYMFISFTIAVWGWTREPLEEISLFQVRKGFCKH